MEEGGTQLRHSADRISFSHFVHIQCIFRLVSEREKILYMYQSLLISKPPCHTMKMGFVAVGGRRLHLGGNVCGTKKLSCRIKFQQTAVVQMATP